MSSRQGVCARFVLFVESFNMHSTHVILSQKEKKQLCDAMPAIVLSNASEMLFFLSMVFRF